MKKNILQTVYLLALENYLNDSKAKYHDLRSILLADGYTEKETNALLKNIRHLVVASDLCLEQISKQVRPEQTEAHAQQAGAHVCKRASIHNDSHRNDSSSLSA